ncbi:MULTISPECIES: DNA polymerase III subunit delta [Paenibacillus]|uniref:DNA polymerase III subunit delta n=1 Tax=Paenibacillus TaxID=44249 RepID=UPI00046EB95D|nr:MULTISPECIES: DNA polymerase III subunit delta [Paenibacillus]MCV9948432.1 DNA polymerase III subunit delta [Paenibacillus sp. BT-177]AZH30389.1 DNA polymerase III subunit delta [Paenibacillus sp. M-152]MEE4569607.1 DNA polymerase III subunit delta [Paenibacillus polymyxa]OAZ50140.1 DNA polymerase III subunit delta [Paenibacillus polymyxa]TKH35483.1 DNA polymerase III subunit delta [Paenibacillus polymyxa]
MDVKTASKAIRKGDISPVYLLYGSEKYQMKQFVDMLKEKVVEEEHRDFAIISYDLTETPIEVVVEDAETAPFLVPKKLIIVRDTSVFAAGKDNGKIEHRLETLLTYMDNPTDYSVIVFTVQAEKLDERKKIVKKLKSDASVIAFAPMGGDDLVAWVHKRAAEREVQLAAGAAERLIQYTGTGLQSLAAEIDKLCLYAGAQGTISSADIESLVPRNTEQNVFAMVEDLANLRLDKALSIFYELLKQKEEPIKIAALITRQFRIMLQVKELAGQSYSQQQIASQLSLHPYGVKVAGDQARRFRPEQLRQLLYELGELDYHMKTGVVDKVLGLELFLMKMGAGASI